MEWWVLKGSAKGLGTLRIKHGGVEVNTDLLVLNHKGNDTASSISFFIKDSDINAKDEHGNPVNAGLEDLLLVRPNNFYRFSFWINTEGIPSNMGAKVKIWQIDTEEKTNQQNLQHFQI